MWSRPPSCESGAHAVSWLECLQALTRRGTPRRLTSISDFSVVNQIYARRFPSNPPARSTFAVSALPLGAKVEIEATAVLPS